MVQPVKTRLLNVRFEIKRHEDEYGLMQPVTKQYHVDIDDKGCVMGIYEEDKPQSKAETIVDMKGMLAVPNFKEMHNHLDKTYMTLGWRGTTPVNNLKERLAAEASELKLLAPSTEQRATKMIETLLHRGVNHIRTHVNIDPYVGLKNLEGIMRAIDIFSDNVTFDVVAFPQHGLLKEDVPLLMKEAMRSGATIVGGLDPGGIDNAVEASLEETMNIATLFDADVDIHLHDRGHLGAYTYHKWLDIIEEANYESRTAISHGFSLGDISHSEQDILIERIKANDMSIMSTIPYGQKSNIPPIDKLRAAGVNVYLGCDGFFDSWSSYVSSDILEKVNHFCQLTGKITEEGISDTLDLVTGGVSTYSEDERIWLKVGDKADMVLTESISSAELIARLPQKRTILLNGKILNSR